MWNVESHEMFFYQRLLTLTTHWKSLKMFIDGQKYPLPPIFELLGSSFHATSSFLDVLTLQNMIMTLL